ncbi:tetratricopeptide repeat protein 24-like isoform X1 [Paroedura picta]|uniref:tetratricopeptide repeat protein 24-like isoform X1 n=1 Tax=Paroedura picta TaxID=143630 RepID=UPI0040579644
MASAPGTPPQSGKRSASPQSEVRRLLKAGARLFQEHQEPRALAAFKKAFLISRCLPEPPLRARCLFNLGAAYIYAGKPGKGLRCTRWARDMGVAEDGDLSFNIAAAYDALGGHAQAAEFYRRAAEQYEARQSLKAAEALVKLGYCLVSTGDPPSAALAFCRAGRAYQEAQRPEEAAMALREAANYWLRSGRYQPAEVLEALQGCSRLCAGITNLELLGHLRNHLGLHYTELQCFGHAEEQFREAMELCRGERCTLRKTAVLLQNMGALCNARLQPQAALPYHKQAAQAYGVLGETAARAQCLYNLATAHTQLGNYREALRDYQQAGKAFGDSGKRRAGPAPQPRPEEDRGGGGATVSAPPVPPGGHFQCQESCRGSIHAPLPWRGPQAWLRRGPCKQKPRGPGRAGRASAAAGLRPRPRGKEEEAADALPSPSASGNVSLASPCPLLLPSRRRLR